ncbi:MAG: PQQ-dependent sugar dehydrogenase [Bacteroidota bacterium]
MKFLVMNAIRLFRINEEFPRAKRIGIYFLCTFHFLSFFQGSLQAQSALGPTQAISKFLNGNLPAITPGEAGSTSFSIVPAYPNLTFQDPLVITPHPRENQLFVASRQGKIERFEQVENVASKQVFLDLSEETAVVWDGGFLGMAFHPEFGQEDSPNRNFFYTYYCAKSDDGTWGPAGCGEKCFTCENDAEWSGSYLRLSRWEVNDGSLIVDSSSELRMVNIRLYGGTHRGGGLTFGNDGFLYCTIGDQARHVTAQSIESNFEGGVIRIDVDQQGGAISHAPRRRMGVHTGFSDESTGIGYYIPYANPWQDTENGLFEEFVQIGNRNPHRMTLDKVTGEMWIGEIGQSSREEVSKLRIGSNAGWPIYEGNLFRQVYNCSAHTLPLSELGTYNPPVADFLRDEANSIIGGYVYRGSAYPSIYGKYVCGDYAQNKLFLLTEQADGSYQKEEFLSFAPGSLITFGQDLQGNLYMGRQSSSTTLYTLKGDSANPPAPSLLSQVGAFKDLGTLEPQEGVIPYEMVESFWSDGADKKRWMALPNDGGHDSPAEQIQFSEEGEWIFPVGSVLIKHFELGGKRLETRFEVHGEDGAYYYLSYKWNTEGTDATLLKSSLDETIEVNGTSQVWHYPSQTECQTCHSNAVNSTLGPRTRYLNTQITYPTTGIRANQLVSLSQAGILNTSISQSQAESFLTMASKDDPNASLEFKARSYLDLNCGYCHRPGTGIRAGFDLRLSTPLEEQNLIYGSLITDLGIEGARAIIPGDLEKSMIYHRSNSLNVNAGVAMPPLAKDKIDTEGVALLAEWIGSMEEESEPVDLDLVLNGDANQLSGGCTELTPNLAEKVGTAWYPIMVDLSKDFTASFNVTLGDQDEIRDQDEGGDGVTFLLQRQGTDLLSYTGGGSGLGASGVTPSLGIEFDTYNSGGPSERAEDHLSIFRNGDLSNVLSGPVCLKSDCSNAEDGSAHTVKVTWNASETRMAVFFDGKSRVDLTYDIVTNIFGAEEKVYVGFTAASGGAYNQQTICNFNISGSFLNPPNPPYDLSTGTLNHDSLTLRWKVNEGEEATIIGYRVYDAESGILVAYSEVTQVTLEGLTPNTAYSYYVVAVDEEGNESMPSEPFTTLTPPEPCTQSLSVSISTEPSSACEDNGKAEIQAEPSGGILEIKDEQDQMVDNVSTLTPGRYTYTYRLGNCIEEGWFSIDREEVPSVSLTVMEEVNIFEGPQVLLGGLPVGGEFSGPGVVDNVLFPEQAGVGLHPITYTYTDENDCVWQAKDTLEIVSRPVEQQSIFLPPIENKTVFDGPFKIEASSTSGLQVSLEVVEGPARIQGDSCILSGTSGIVMIEATQQGSEEVKAADPKRITFEVRKVEQALSFFLQDSVFALDGPFDPGIEASSGLPLTWGILSGPANIWGDKIKLAGVSGEVVLWASQEGNDQYLPSETYQFSFEVHRVAQYIQFEDIPPVTIDTNFIYLHSEASSGLEVGYELLDGPATLVDPNHLILWGEPGVIELKAYQPGDSTFLPAKDIFASIQVNNSESIQDSLSVNTKPLLNGYSKDIWVFPNPADKELFVQWDNPHIRLKHYYLHTIDGRLLQYKPLKEKGPGARFRINVTKIPRGTHLITLHDEEGRQYNLLWVKQ